MMRAIVRLLARAAGAALLALAALPCVAQYTVNATNDLACAGTRGATGCTAGEFTTIVQLSNPSPLNCVAGQYVTLSASIQLSGTNTDRFNVGWLTGQDGNDPRATTGNCSVAVMPTSPDPPWFLASTANTCGDYRGGASSTVTVTNMKVLCQGDAGGNLQVPYTLIYAQNDKAACTGPADIQSGSASKCNAGTAILPVSTFAVLGGITVTKNTLPAASPQTFGFTAVSSDPTNHPVQPGDASFTLGDTQSHQVKMQITGTATTLTIAETAVAGWEPASTISCTKPDGSSAAGFITIDNANRTITAQMSNANPLANCTIVNTKQPTLAITKVSNGSTGSYTFSGNNGWTNQVITTAASGTGVAGAMQTLAKSATVTTLNETLPAGQALASVACSGLNGGTVASTPAGSATFDASAMAPGNNLACTVNNTVLPTLTKAFVPAVVAANQASRLTFTIANVTGALAQAGVAFTDTLPAGLVIATLPGASTTCAGTPGYTATAGTGTFTASGLNVAAGASSCTVSVNVSSATPATYTNGAAQISGLASLANAVTSQSLVVQQAPAVTKSFAAANLASGGSTSLTVTLGNPNAAAITLSGAFTDAFPAGMTINAAGSSGTCAGVTANAGDSSFTVASGTAIAPGGCSVIVSVTSSTPGTATNTVAAGALQTSAGNSAAAVSASIGVYAPPTAAKTFTPAAIVSGGTSTMKIVVTNPAANPGNLTGASIADAYAGTLRNNAAGSVSCTAGSSATLNGGANNGTSVGFGSATLAPGGSCTITQSVTATATIANTTSAPAASGPAALTGSPASDTLTILGPPTVAKSFGTSDVALGGNTSLTVTIGNPNAGAISLTGAFTDAFPAGIAIGIAGNTGTCAGVTATAGANSFTIANGTSIPAGGCTVVVDIATSSAGAKANTIAAGALLTSAGANAAAASATLNVYAPPTVAKAFGAPAIPFNGTTTLTISIANPAANPGPVGGIAVSDVFPTGLQVAAVPGFANSCGGTVSPGQTGGDTSLVLTGGSALAAGASCQVQVAVTGTTAGAKNNTTGAVSATAPVALTGVASNTATTTVSAAPTVAKAFGAASLASGASTSLTLTLGNTNAGTITLASPFTDAFPAGMTIGTAGNTGTCAGVTANAASASLTIASGTSIASGGCTVVVNVTSSTAGTATNTIAAGTLQTTAGGNPSAASASLDVYAPPTVTKSFAPSAIASGGTSTLTITVTNPASNPGNLTGIAVNDPYTGSLRNAAAGSVACSGAGSSTLTGGALNGTSVGFSAGTIVPGGTCTITQAVTATGTNTNATTAPAATGPVPLSGTAATGVVLTILAPPTVTKSFGAASIAAGGSTSLTVTVGNSNAAAVALTSGLVDTFPAGMTIGTAGNGGTCAGVTATAGANAFTIANGTSIPAGGCTVVVNVTSSTMGAAANTIAAGALQTTAGPNATAASATLDVYGPPTVTKSFSPASIASGGATTLTIVAANPASNPGSLTGVAVNDAYTGTLRNTAAGSVTCSAGSSASLAGGANNGTSVGLSGGTLAPGGSCTITQPVTATSTNTNATNAPTAAGPVALSGTAATGVVLAVLGPPTVAKSFGTASLASGANTSLTVTVGNANASAITLTSALTDTFPAGLTIGAAGNSGTCAGVTASAGAGNFTVASATSIPAGGCTVVVNVTSSTPGTATNTLAAGALQTSAGPNAAGASAAVDVYAPPIATKSFAPSTIGPGGTSTLTITVTNPASNPGALSGVAIGDTYAGTLANDAAGSVACSAGSSATLAGGANGGTSVGLTGGTLLAAGSCTITQAVTAGATTANTTTSASAAGPVALSGGSASATLTVGSATLSKAFAPAAIAAGGTSTLAFTLANTAGNPAQSGIGFADALSTGLSVAAVPNVQTNCPSGGAFAAPGFSVTAAGGSISVVGASLAAGVASCQVKVDVTANVGGTYTNDASNMGGLVKVTNAVTPTTLTVGTVAPALAKQFAPANIAASGVSTLTLTLTNANASAATLTAALVDPFPSGLLIAATPNASTTCAGSGAVGASAGGTSLSLPSTRSIPAASGGSAGSCTVSVDVTSPIGGTYANTIAAGALQTSNGNNAAAASASLTVAVAAPTLAKAFAPSTIAAGGTSTVTLTLGNPNDSAASLAAALVDALPAGVTIAATPNASTTCPGSGALVANAGAGSASLPATRGIPAGGGTTPGTCTVSFDVTASAGGSYTNTLAANALQTSNGNNASAAAATLDVGAVAPSLAKSFAPPAIAAGGTSTLTITLTNPNNTAASLSAALVDTLPAGLVVAAAPNASTTCAGSGAVTAVAGGSTITLPATRSIPGGSPGSCTVTVDVTASLGGTYANTLAAGALQTSQGGNAAAASASLAVNAVAPTLAKSFAPAGIALGATSTLTIALSNANTTAASLTSSLVDALPAGMTVAATPNASTSCAGSGALVAAAGASSITLPATRAIPAGSGATPGACTISVDITSAQAGNATNTLAAGALQTSNGANAAAASASLSVTALPPTATKAFAPSAIAPNATSVLTIVLTNPNGAPLTAVAVTDNYPAGLVNTGTPSASLSGAGCAGSVAAAAGGASVSLSGATLPANGSCTVSVNVTATAPGAYANSTGTIASGNAGNGAAASATLDVFSPPTVTKGFAPTFIPLNGTATLTIVVANPAANPAPLTGAALADPYPAGLANAGAGSVSCTGGGSATLAGGANGGTSVGFSGATIAPGGSCTITQAVTSNANVTNTTSTATSNEAPAGGAASASLAVAAPASLAKSFSPATIPFGGTSTLTFTVTNPNPIALTGAAFTDTLSGMAIDAAGAAGGSCAGAGGNSFAAGQASLAFGGLAVPASASCTVTVIVRGTAPGAHDDTASGVSSNQAATGAPSNTATLTVTSTSPTLAKSFAPATIDPGVSATLTVTVGNANGAAIGIASLTDTYPSGMVTAATANASTTCAGGSVSTAAGSATLTGGTVPANGSCTFQVDVTSSSAGAALVNTLAVGALTTNVGANAVAASATLNVRPSADLSITKSAAATVASGGTVTYTVVVANAGPQAANGAVVSDAVPAVVAGVAAACGSATGAAACGAVTVSGNNVSGTIATLPAGGSVTFTVTGTAPASGTFTNTATVATPAGVSDPSDPNRTGAGNNSASASITVVAPDLRLTKSHAGSFVVGANGVYTLTVDNTLGTAPTSGTITVVDTLPAGLGYVSAVGTGWACAAAGQVVTCTGSAVIAAGATSADPITLTVTVAPTAVPSVTNSASVSGGAEPAANAANDNAFDPTLVVKASSNTFAPDNAQSGAPGTVVFYAHAYQAGAAGSVTFGTVAIATPATPGWTEAIFRDSDCSGTLNGAEGASPLAGAVAVNAGDTVCIIVRESIPGAAPYNAQSVVSVTATPSSGAAITRTDTTTVGATAGAGLTLGKSVRNVTQSGSAATANTARPNDLLEYTITFTNTSSGAITSIVVTDATPAYTLFQSAACGSPLAANLTTCSVTAQPAANGTGSVVWTLGGSLLSGGSGSVSYQVRVAP